jgi:hypothetical protein
MTMDFRKNLKRLGAAAFTVFLIKGLVWVAVAGAALWKLM